MVPTAHSFNPLLMYGLGGEFHYKNFTIGVLFMGTGRTDYFRGGAGYTPFYEGRTGNVLKQAADPRNPLDSDGHALANGIDPSLAENPNAIYPRLQYGYNSNNSQTSDFWKGNARYLPSAGGNVEL